MRLKAIIGISVFVFLTTMVYLSLKTPQTVQAQTPTKLPAASSAQAKKNKPPYHWSNHFEWTSEEWRGNNKPYQTARDQINQALASQPTSGKALLAKYQSVAKAHPGNPLALFRWAYLSLRLAPTPQSVGEDGLDLIRDAFARPSSPHTYDYTRLRYLLYQHSSPDQRLISLGARLLKHNPDDLSVRYAYLSSLRNSSKLSDRQTALAEIQKIIQQHPKEATPYALLGSIYLMNWVDDKLAGRPKKANADLCIAAYQQYLNHAPASDPFRKNAQDEIAWVQSR